VHREILREELTRTQEPGRDAYWQDYSKRYGPPLEICLDPDRLDEYMDEKLAEHQPWKEELHSKQVYWRAGVRYVGGYDDEGRPDTWRR
jgi:hypothetical protein